MSYKTWHTYGYGICVDDIEEIEPARLQELIDMEPALSFDFYKLFKEWKEDDEDFDPNDIDTYIKAADDLFDYGGISGIICHVMSKVEGINFIYCDDYDATNYVLFCPRYSWNMTEKEKMLTADELNNIFGKYINILTDQTVNVNYYDVENGG